MFVVMISKLLHFLPVHRWLNFWMFLLQMILLMHLMTCTFASCLTDKIHQNNNRYLVTSFMQSDLDNAIKIQPITDDQVQLLVYQILRGLKVIQLFRFVVIVALISVHSFSWCNSSGKLKHNWWYILHCWCSFLGYQTK